jgi:hypothetical protein
MTGPTPAQVRVATDALRRAAAGWDSQAGVLGGMARAVTATALDRGEAGVFQIILGAYAELVDAVAARCREGQGAMTAIAGTLRTVADRYDAEDASGEHRLRGLY